MIKSALALALLVHCGVYAQQEQFKCPHEYGFYPHAKSCDKYWKCENSEAELKTCGNGLAFDSNDPKFLTENCDYLHNVQCGDRTELEPPIPAPNCPRMYGIFPDEERCDVFWNCWNGESNKYSCAPGLAYDREARVCMWADQVPECRQDASQGGFKCPPASANPNPGTFSRHAHPEDCRKYYVCLEGSPREYGCPIGTVFKIGADEYSGQCTDPEGVDGCENYYGDDLKGLKKSDLLLGLTGSDGGSSSYAVTNKPIIRKKTKVIEASPAPQQQVAPSQQQQQRVPQQSTRTRAPASRPAQTTQQSRPTTTEAPKADANKSDDYYYYDQYEEQQQPNSNSQQQPQQRQ